jgi:hypothetical protein
MIFIYICLVLLSYYIVTLTVYIFQKDVYVRYVYHSESIKTIENKEVKFLYLNNEYYKSLFGIRISKKQTQVITKTWN